MKKTAFKTFVCSFVFSLFILFTINGLFFYTPEATSQNVKIPSKNISLFFMGDAGGAVSAKVRPIKKIALSLPPQKKPAQATETVYAPAKLPPLPPSRPFKRRQKHKTNPLSTTFRLKLPRQTLPICRRSRQANPARNSFPPTLTVS